MGIYDDVYLPMRDEINKLKAENKRLRKDIIGWINWCYYLPKDWKPKPMIEKSKQVLKG